MYVILIKVILTFHFNCVLYIYKCTVHTISYMMTMCVNIVRYVSHLLYECMYVCTCTHTPNNILRLIRCCTLYVNVCVTFYYVITVISSLSLTYIRMYNDMMYISLALYYIPSFLKMI